MNQRLLAAALLALPLPVLAQTVAPEVAATPADEDARPLDPAAVPARVVAAREAARTDTIAYDLVRDLTTQVGPRMPGTAAEARAREWAVRAAERPWASQTSALNPSTCRCGSGARSAPRWWPPTRTSWR